MTNVEPPIPVSDDTSTQPSPESTKDERTLAMLCHLLALFTGFLGPLIIWLIKKDEMPFVDDQGKESLNFQITMLIAWTVSGLLACVFIGFVLLPIVMVVDIVFVILASIKASGGEAYRYPVCLRLIK